MGNIVQHRTHRNNRYTTINLTAVEDKRLSGLAKAIHLYAMSRPPDWTLTMQDIYNRFKEGRDAIYVALQCLVDAGYLHRNQDRNNQSKFSAVVYHWFEEPRPDMPFTEIPDTAAPDTEIPVNGKPATTIYQDYVPQALGNQGVERPMLTSADLPEWMNRSGSTGADKPTADNPEHSINQEELTTEVLTKEEDGTPPPAPMTGQDWAKAHIDCMTQWYAVAQNLRRKLKAHTGSSTVWLAAKLRETYADIYAPEAVDAQIDKRVAEGRTDCKYWELFTEGNNGRNRQAGAGRSESRYAAIVQAKDTDGEAEAVDLSKLLADRDI